MSNLRHLLSAVALCCVTGLPAFAQNGGGLASTYMTADHHLRASQLVGKQVYNDKGQAIGTIDDVLVGVGNAPTSVVLSVGAYLGTGAKMVEAPLDHIRLEGNHPTMAGADRQALASMSSYVYMPMIERGAVN